MYCMLTSIFAILAMYCMLTSILVINSYINKQFNNLCNQLTISLFRSQYLI